jgi:hypothetical protein
MTTPPLAWTVGLAVLAVLLLIALVWSITQRRRNAASPLPSEWSLSPRPVFSTDERRVYRQLREALPHHIILSKLPLVRFCQPNDPEQVRYWYDLLGSIHVTFAVCSANGRVLAVIDLDNERGGSRRVLQIKQSVLGACRIRYLRCPVDHLPSVPELQLLVPHNSAARAPQPAPAHNVRNISQARDTLASTVASRRAARTALWQDSSFFQDSFFAPDARDDYATSEFAPLSPASGATNNSRYANTAPPDEASHSSQGAGDDIAGVVVDTPRYPPPHTRR